MRRGPDDHQVRQQRRDGKDDVKAVAAQREVDDAADPAANCPAAAGRARGCSPAGDRPAPATSDPPIPADRQRQRKGPAAVPPAPAHQRHRRPHRRSTRARRNGRRRPPWALKAASHAAASARFTFSLGVVAPQISPIGTPAMTNATATTRALSTSREFGAFRPPPEQTRRRRRHAEAGLGRVRLAGSVDAQPAEGSVARTAADRSCRQSS